MSSKVRRLDPLVAERIAAGEVIERPSSVVKELVENSLDAGATEVQVTLEDGGKGLIEVLDNGTGMGPEDLQLCLERHATSKLSTLDDLERIRTLGFRGEALPSVAAVSDLSILSREQGSSVTHEIRLPEQREPKAVTFGHFLNTPHGTRIQARGLFSQVPARLKFLKSQAAEVGQVREWLERLAAAHPQTGFKLVSDGRTVLQLRPQDEPARVKSILAHDEDYPVLTVSNARDGFRDVGLKIRLHWLQGFSTPQTRKILQVVNGRVLKDRLLQQAMLGPFRQALLPGQFPGLALFIEINPAAIDVNVHPSKTEIRFLDSRKIFKEVEGLVESLIQEHGAPAVVPAPAPLATIQGLAPSSWSAREAMQGFAPAPMPAWSPSPAPAPLQHSFVAQLASVDTRQDNELTDVRAPSNATAPHPILDGSRYVGILFNTYILYDQGEEMVMVDQHAAHERIRYEKLRKRALADGKPHSQALLIPEAIRFEDERRAELEGKLPWLERIGFEVEIFGEGTLLFRGVPAEWGLDALKMRLKNLTERVLETEAPRTDSANPFFFDEEIFERLASEACHSAIRAGDRILEPEAEQLARDLFRCEHPWNCPHGRPTVVRVPQGKLEEWFQRRANV